MTIAGTRFVGATLWTDYAIWQGDVDAGQAAAGRDMNDFRYIRAADYERRLMPSMLAESIAATWRRSRRPWRRRLGVRRWW